LWSGLQSSPRAPNREGRATIRRDDRLVGLGAFEDGEAALQEIGGIEAGMRVQSRIYLRSHFDNHYYRFIGTIRQVKFSMSVRVIVPA
jgi:hypothetical protein